MAQTAWQIEMTEAEESAISHYHLHFDGFGTRMPRIHSRHSHIGVIRVEIFRF